MLDDFRKQADTPSFFEEEEKAPQDYEEEIVRTKRYLFGMSPVQRFVIAVMLFLIVFLVGSFALLVTEKVVLPFLV